MYYKKQAQNILVRSHLDALDNSIKNDHHKKSTNEQSLNYIDSIHLRASSDALYPLLKHMDH